MGPAMNDATANPSHAAQAGAAPDRSRVVDRLRLALSRQGPAYAEASLTLLQDKGLAHDHVRIDGEGMLARLPKQSQMGLGPTENLAYQAACYRRASASGHAPRLVATLAPDEALPRGALLVEYVEGRPARLPCDLPAIVTALARIHSLPVPPADERPPLANPADPLADLLAEIGAQRAFLEAARVESATRAIIEAEHERLEALCSGRTRPDRHLISFDAHPGNFLICRDGSAVLVDLEKCRYSAPPLDLAHATLYTSTTWDVATNAVLTAAEVEAAYRLWEQQFGGDAEAMRPWLVPLRRGMWLWSVTWCAKWRATSGRPPASHHDGEDWSRDHSDATLVAYVQNRVDHYLAAATARHVVEELNELECVFSRLPAWRRSSRTRINE